MNGKIHCIDCKEEITEKEFYICGLLEMPALCEECVYSRLEKIDERIAELRAEKKR